MEDKNKTETRTPKVTKGTETPETRAEVANGSAITADPVESGPETRQVVYENMPKVVNGAAVSVKEGTVITVKTDERNILQKGLDSIAEVFTNIDGWLEDTAEEMADYDYGGWLNIFAEYGQGYAGRGGSFTVARLLGCVTKGGEKLCYGIFAGSINLFSHPIQAAGSIDKIPEGVQEGWNQFKNGNWTQRVEIATEVVGTVAMLAEAGVKMKNARNAAKARAEMEGILAEDAEAISKLEGVGAGTSEITEDMRRLLEEYRKLSEEEQWSMWKETGCFLAGTKVSTVEGMRNIEEIPVGEEVYAENTISGESEKRKVTRISHQKASAFVYLRINGNEIWSTMEHPFWHKEKGWIKAGELLPGDTLKQRDGRFVKVTYICQKKAKEQWVYNLEVEGLHTYYVAEGELLVHNGEGVCPEGKVKIESAGRYSDIIKWGIHDIEVRPEGKGFWGRRIKQNNPRVDGYELKINPNNESYYLPHPNGGFVQFENMINSTVQDGKLIMKQKSFYHVNDMPDFAKNKVLLEAQRQLDAATQVGYNVEWLVSDESAANQLKDLFKNKNMDIKIIFYPE